MNKSKDGAVKHTVIEVFYYKRKDTTKRKVIAIAAFPRGVNFPPTDSDLHKSSKSKSFQKVSVVRATDTF